MPYPYALPDIESRFLPNENWKMGFFHNAKTVRDIHYGASLIKNATKNIVLLPGLSEFSEKYIETAQFFNTRRYNVYVIDWAYQGRSCRHEDNPHKRHSNGYEADISDLKHFIDQVINSSLPLYMLGHSMGGHLGLRYLATQNHNIKAASFSTPMLGIKGLGLFPACLSFLLKPFKNLYVPGGRDWVEHSRQSDGTGIFSSDIMRDKVHNAWSIPNPELQIGSPTFKWVIESLKSIKNLRSKKTLKAVNIPIFFGIAENEKLVSNTVILKVAKILPNAEILELENAKHEILMETDDIRNLFLNKTLETFNR